MSRSDNMSSRAFDAFSGPMVADWEAQRSFGLTHKVTYDGPYFNFFHDDSPYVALRNLNVMPIYDIRRPTQRYFYRMWSGSLEYGTSLKVNGVACAISEVQKTNEVLRIIQAPKTDAYNIYRESFYHGTSSERLDSLLHQPPMNMGNNHVSGPGICGVVKGDIDTAKTYASLAHNRVGSESKAIVAEGHFNPRRKLDVGIIRLKNRDIWHSRDMLQGMFRSNWSFSHPYMLKAIHDNYDVLYILDAAKSHSAMLPDKFMVVTPRAGKGVLVWDRYAVVSSINTSSEKWEWHSVVAKESIQRPSRFNRFLTTVVMPAAAAYEFSSEYGYARSLGCYDPAPVLLMTGARMAGYSAGYMLPELVMHGASTPVSVLGGISEAAYALEQRVMPEFKSHCDVIDRMVEQGATNQQIRDYIRMNPMANPDVMGQLAPFARLGEYVFTPAMSAIHRAFTVASTAVYTASRDFSRLRQRVQQEAVANPTFSNLMALSSLTGEGVDWMDMYSLPTDRSLTGMLTDWMNQPRRVRSHHTMPEDQGGLVGQVSRLFGRDYEQSFSNWMQQRRNIRPSLPALEPATQRTLMGDMQATLDSLRPVEGAQLLSEPFTYNGTEYHYRLPGLGYAQTAAAAERGLDAFQQLGQSAQAQLREGKQRSLLMLYSEQGAHEWGVSPTLRQDISNDAFHLGDLPNAGLCAGTFIHINTAVEDCGRSLSTLSTKFSEFKRRIDQANPFNGETQRLFEEASFIIPAHEELNPPLPALTEADIDGQHAANELQVQLENFFDQPEIAEAVEQVRMGNVEQQVPEIVPIGQIDNGMAFQVPLEVLPIPQEVQDVLGEMANMTADNMIAINAAIESSDSAAEECNPEESHLPHSDALPISRLKKSRHHQAQENKSKPPFISNFKLAMIEGLPGIEVETFDGASIGVGFSAAGWVIKVTAPFGPAFWSTFLTGLGVGAAAGGILMGISLLRAHSEKKKLKKAIGRIEATEKDCHKIGDEIKQLLQRMNNQQLHLDAKLADIDRQISRCIATQSEIRGRSVTDRRKVCYEFSESQESASRAIQEKIDKLYELKDSVIFDSVRQRLEVELPALSPSQLQERCAELEKVNGHVLTPAQLAEMNVMRNEVITRAYSLIQEGDEGLQQAIDLVSQSEKIFFHLVPDMQEIRWHDKSGYGRLSRDDKREIAKYNNAVRQLKEMIASGKSAHAAFARFFQARSDLEARWQQEYNNREHEEQNNSGYDCGKRDEWTLYRKDREARLDWIKEQNKIANQQKKILKGNPKRTMDVEGLSDELKSIKVLRSASDFDVLEAYVNNVEATLRGDKSDVCDVFVDKGLRDIIMQRVMSSAYRGDTQASLELMAKYRDIERVSDKGHNEKIQSTIQRIHDHRNEDVSYFFAELKECSQIKLSDTRSPDNDLNYKLARLRMSAAHDRIDHELNSTLLQGDLDASKDLLEELKASDPEVTVEVDAQLDAILELQAYEEEGFDHWQHVHQTAREEEKLYLESLAAQSQQESQLDDLTAPDRSRLKAFKVKRLYALKKQLSAAEKAAARGRYKYAHDLAAQAITEEPYVQGGSMYKIPMQYYAQYQIQVIGAFIGPVIQHAAQVAEFSPSEIERRKMARFMATYTVMNTIFPQLPEMLLKLIFSNAFDLRDTSLVQEMLNKYLIETSYDFTSAAGSWMLLPAMARSSSMDLARVSLNVLCDPSGAFTATMESFSTFIFSMRNQILEQGTNLFSIQYEKAMDGFLRYSPRLQAHLAVAQLSLMGLRNISFNWLPYSLQQRVEPMRNSLVARGQTAVSGVQLANAVTQLYSAAKAGALTTTPTMALHANLVTSLAVEGLFGAYDRWGCGDGHLSTDTITYKGRSLVRFGVEAASSTFFLVVATEGLGVIPIAMMMLRGYFLGEQILSNRAHYYASVTAISAALTNINHWGARLSSAKEDDDVGPFKLALYQNWDKVGELLSDLPITPELKRANASVFAYGDDEFLNAARIGYVGSLLIRKYDELIEEYNKTISNNDEDQIVHYREESAYKIRIVDPEIQGSQERLIEEMLGVTIIHDDKSVCEGCYPAYLALEIIRFRLLAMTFSPARIHQFPVEYQKAIDAVESTMTDKWRHDNFERVRDMFKSSVIALYLGVIRLASTVYFPELLPKLDDSADREDYESCLSAQKEKLIQLLGLLEKVYKYVADPWDVLLNDSQKIALAQFYMKLGNTNKSKQVLRTVLDWRQFFKASDSQHEESAPPSSSDGAVDAEEATRDDRGQQIIRMLSVIDPNLSRQVILAHDEAKSVEMLNSYITALIDTQQWEDALKAIEENQLSTVSPYDFYSQYIYYARGDVVNMSDLLSQMVSVPNALRDLSYWSYIERITVDMLGAVGHSPKINYECYLACQCVNLCVLQKQLGHVDLPDQSDYLEARINELGRAILINLGHHDLKDKKIELSKAQKEILKSRIDEATRVVDGHTEADIFRLLVSIYTNSLYKLGGGYSFVAEAVPDDGECAFHCIGVKRSEALEKLKQAVKPSGLGVRFLWGEQQQQVIVNMLFDHMEYQIKEFSRDAQPRDKSIAMALKFIDNHKQEKCSIDSYQGRVGLLDAIAYLYGYNLEVYVSDRDRLTLVNNKLYHEQPYETLRVLLKESNSSSHYIKLRTVVMPIQEVVDTPLATEVALPMATRCKTYALTPDHGWATCNLQTLQDINIGDDGISAVFNTQYDNWWNRGERYSSVATLKYNGKVITQHNSMLVLAYQFDSCQGIEAHDEAYAVCLYKTNGSTRSPLFTEQPKKLVKIDRAHSRSYKSFAQYDKSGRYCLIWGNGLGFVCDKGHVINRFAFDDNHVVAMKFSPISSCFFVVFKERATEDFYLKVYRLNAMNAELGVCRLNDFVTDLASEDLLQMVHFANDKACIFIYNHDRIIELAYDVQGGASIDPIIYPTSDMARSRCFPLKDGQHLKILPNQFVFFDTRHQRESLVKYSGVNGATLFHVDAAKSRIAMADDVGKVRVYSY